MATTLEQIIPRMLGVLRADVREDIRDIIKMPIKCGSCPEIIKRNNNGEDIFYFGRARNFYLGRTCLLSGVKAYREKSHDREIPLKEMIKEAKKISYEEMRELSKNKFQYRK